jgi:hypothetical protein
MNKIPIILFLFFSLILLSCNNATNTNVTKQYGIISGYVKLIDNNQRDNEIKNFDSVNVKIQELSLSTFTDSIGNWKFNDVETGNYTLIFTKNNYGTLKLYSQKVDANKNNNIGKTEILQLPKFFIDSISLKLISGNIISIYCQVKNYIQYSAITYQNFFITSKYTNLSYFDENYKDLIWNQFWITSDDHFTREIPVSTLLNSGFKSGDTLYLQGYISFDQSYIDPKTNKKVFTCVNHQPSTKIKFIIQ